MYRFERLLLDARGLRIGRAIRAKEGDGQVQGDKWLAEWQAATLLVLELAGVDLSDDGSGRSDGRRTGRADILNLDLLVEFAERGAEALRELAQEMALEERLFEDTVERIRQKFAEEVPAASRRLGKAKPNGGTDEELAARRTVFVETFLRTKKPAIRDAAVLAIESGLLDVVKTFRETNDLQRKLVVREEGALDDNFEIVGGQLRRRRKARAKKRPPAFALGLDSKRSGLAK